jgi:tetratricopeptide (TPR) repeat protein
MMSKRFLVSILVCIAMLFLHGCAGGPPPSAVELGEAALESGDWRSAKTHFAEALRAEPRLGRAWLGQARAQLAGRDPEAALRSLTSLSKVDRERFLRDARPTYVDSLDAAARSRLERDKSEAALAAVRALAKLDPGRRDLDRLVGRALIAEADRVRWRGDPKSALALYREACRTVPRELDAWIGAAEILLEFNRGKEAMNLLEAARKTHPTAGQIRTLTIQALSLR